MPTLVDAIMPMFKDQECEYLALHCLPAIAPDRRDVFERVAEAARPSPPRMRPIGAFEQYDEVMWRRGAAIDGLGYFTAFAPEAVAILIEALDTFVEHDRDLGYEQYGRVDAALEQLGPAAAAAVPALLSRLRNDHGCVDWRIVRFLGRMGPLAKEALPILLKLHAEIGENGSDAPSWADAPNEDAHLLSWAIQRVAGTPRPQSSTKLG